MARHVQMSHEWRRLLKVHPSVCQLLAERHKPLEGLAAYVTECEPRML